MYLYSIIMQKESLNCCKFVGRQSIINYCFSIPIQILRLAHENSKLNVQSVNTLPCNSIDYESSSRFPYYWLILYVSTAFSLCGLTINKQISHVPIYLSLHNVKKASISP